jgi:hypothetical protein
MTLKEVEDIIGSRGEEKSSSESEKAKTIPMQWESDGFKMILATLSNDKLTIKMQANLY